MHTLRFGRKLSLPSTIGPIPNGLTEGVEVSSARNTTRSAKATSLQSMESFRPDIGEVPRSIGNIPS